MSQVCVHGLGYIGLPTASMLANYGHDVVGYDTDSEVRTALENGDVHIDEPGLRAFVTEAIESGNLELADDVAPAKYHVICVPTPLDKESGMADLRYVEAAGAGIHPQLRTGDTVILESTVPPRTTIDTLRPILEESGLSGGTDFALVYCPETVLPGNVITELRQNDRIVGGVNGVSAEAAVHLYESFVEGEIVTAPDATTAEFVKLIGNTYRDTNIALANEIAKLASDYGIDSRTAIALSNRHPRVDIHQPGPGVGGHCLPIDPWFLGQGSEKLDLIAHAREVNDQMVNHVIDLLAAELPERNRVKIAILGIAYKGNISDTRNSPGLTLARTLQYRAAIDGDSHTGTDQLVRTTDGGEAVKSGSVSKSSAKLFEDVEIALQDSHVDSEHLLTLDDALSGADGAIITTDHAEYEELDAERFAEQGVSVVIDTKGVLDPSHWAETPVTFKRI